MSGNKSVQQQSFPPGCRINNGTFSPQNTMFVQANGQTFQLVNIPQSPNGGAPAMRFVTSVVNPVVSGNINSAVSSAITSSTAGQNTIQARPGSAIIRYVTAGNATRLQIPLPMGARALAPTTAGQLPGVARPANAGNQITTIRAMSPQVSASQQQHTNANSTTLQATNPTQSAQLVRRPTPISTAGPRPQNATLASGIQHPTHTIASPLMTTRPGGAAVPLTRTAILQPSQLALLRGVSPQLINSQTSGLTIQPNLQTHTPVTAYGTTAPAQPSATAPSQMRPEEALKKCSSFLSTLLFKCQDQVSIYPKQVFINVQNLIQALIDGRIQTIDFTEMLQKELNSEPQTTLAPFLTRALPLLRQSMINGETTIPGIRPPNQPLSNPSSLQSPSRLHSESTQQRKKKSPQPPGFKTKYAIAKEKKEARLKEKLERLANEDRLEKQIKQEKLDKQEKQVSQDKSDKLDIKEKQQKKQDRQKRQDKQKKQEKQLESFSSALRDDDDVNDVAAMGGVNLAEESQRIMAAGAELVGTQIRSCKDEPFLETKPLFSRIAAIAIKNNLSEPSAEVVALVSHAVQERLKNLVERLGVFAEHRCENLKFNPRYEVTQDVRGQIKFLSELDRIEKRRHEEQEREMLLRAAKSRSKLEDPEQLKLRQKAKEMQRAEQEEARQREANETALLAIGPRKKMKSNNVPANTSLINQPNDPKNIQTPMNEPFRRVKRVNMRDLQFLLEHEKAQLNRLMRLCV